MIDDLNRGETLMERYSTIPSPYNNRCKLVGKYVNIPAKYWGSGEELQRKQWWTSEEHLEQLRKLSYQQVQRTLLVGKVLGK